MTPKLKPIDLSPQTKHGLSVRVVDDVIKKLYWRINDVAFFLHLLSKI